MGVSTRFALPLDPSTIPRTISVVDDNATFRKKRDKRRFPVRFRPLDNRSTDSRIVRGPRRRRLSTEYIVDGVRRDRKR